MMISFLKLLTAVTFLASSSSSSTVFGPLITPPNPYMGVPGLATMHGDAASSDSTLFPGPGTGKITSTRVALQSACPTLLATSDGYLFALCTTIFGRVPTVHLFSPGHEDNEHLAELPMIKGNVLGGIYAYVDQLDRLVLINGRSELLRIAKVEDDGGSNGVTFLHRRQRRGYRLEIVDTLSLASAIPDPDDSVVGLAPDWQGLVWFATASGLVGVADPVSRQVTSIPLREPSTSSIVEQVANSISTSPAGTAISTTHATYLLTRTNSNLAPPNTNATASLGIEILWRQRYDRGPARKPGQLSWGTGSTPTFFGPKTGYEYTTIVDNAHPLVHLLVYDTKTGTELCNVALMTASNAGSEISPIASGRAVIVASTYGYPYPSLQETSANPSQPASAPFVGGLTRVDVAENPAQNGCTVQWTQNALRSAAVPKLSIAERRIYTILRHNPLAPASATTTILDNFYYAVINADSGAVETKQLLGTGFLFDSLQMAGLTLNETLYQGTITGFVRVRKA